MSECCGDHAVEAPATVDARARYSVEPATFRDGGAPVKGLPDHQTGKLCCCAE
jgi:hypothetical protein